MYILPYKERRRLHGRAYRAQQFNHSEICGVLIVGPDKKIELHFLQNVSNKPYHYELAIEAIRSIQRNLRNQRKKILGSFHSHPVGEAVPGDGDIDNGFYKGIEMIYDVCAREIKLWRLKKDGKDRKIEEIPLIVESQERKKGRENKGKDTHYI